jgi:hypothetical protein
MSELKRKTSVTLKERVEKFDVVNTETGTIYTDTPISISDAKLLQRSFVKANMEVYIMKSENQTLSEAEILSRFPLIVSHIICHSLGYATPSCAARILHNAIYGKRDWCEWIDACYKGDALMAVQDAIEFRGSHNGYMADINYARALVDKYTKDNKQPELASWF